MKGNGIRTTLADNRAGRGCEGAWGAVGIAGQRRPGAASRRRGYAARSARCGLTLIETMVACSLLAIIAVIGSRLVFLTDRAIQRERTEATGNARVLQLAANLRRDISTAARVELTQKPVVLKLQMSEKKTVTYENAAEGLVREEEYEREEDEARGEYEGMAGLMGARIFPELSVDFSGSSADLVRAAIKEDGEVRTRLAMHPRKASVESARNGSEGR